MPSIHPTLVDQLTQYGNFTIASETKDGKMGFTLQWRVSGRIFFKWFPIEEEAGPLATIERLLLAAQATLKLQRERILEIAGAGSPRD